MTLNSQKPEAHDLMNLGSFDLAFLRLTGNVRFVPLNQLVVNVLKSSKAVVGWGPQAKLMGAVLRKSWNEHVGTMLEDVVDSFDTGKLEVDEKKISLILGSKKFKTLGSKVWASSEKKVLQLIAMTEEQAYKHFMNQRKEVEKAQATKTLSSAMGSKMGAILDSYPVGTLDPEIGRLVNLAKTAPNLRTIDKVDIIRRIEGIEGLPTKYLDNMGDVSTGRVWSVTGMNMASARGVSTYQIIANITRTTCKVCERVDGSTFTVAGAQGQIEDYLEGGEEIRFVRFSEVDNLSPDQMSEMNIIAPLHPACRCNTVFLWKSAGQVRYGPDRSMDLKQAVYTGKMDTKSVNALAKALKNEPDIDWDEARDVYKAMLDNSPNNSFYAMKIPLPGKGELTGAIARIDEVLTAKKGAIRVEGLYLAGESGDAVRLTLNTLVRGMVNDEVALRGFSKARKLRFAQKLMPDEWAVEMGMLKKKGQWVLDQNKYKALLDSDMVIKPPKPVIPRPPRPPEPKPPPAPKPEPVLTKKPLTDISKEAKRIDTLPDEERVIARRKLFDSMTLQKTKEYTVNSWPPGLFDKTVDDALLYIKTEDLLDMKNRRMTINFNPEGRDSWFSGTTGKMNIQSSMSSTTVSETIAHEMGHAMDSAWSSGSAHDFSNAFGFWKNGTRVDYVEGVRYREWYNARHTGEIVKGSYKNNWINAYDGRVYNRTGGVDSIAEEWLAMNCERYNTYLMHERTVKGYLDDLIKKFPDGITDQQLKMTTLRDAYKATIAGTQTIEEGVLKLASKRSKWGKVQKKYPELAKFIERKFEKSRVKYPTTLPKIIKE